MRFIRGLIFSFLFYGMTAVMAIIGLPLLLLPQPVTFFWQWLWARLMMILLALICGITSRIEGDIPHQQVIYAVKHQSAWETIVLLALLHQPVTVMKRSLLMIPLFGLYLARFGVMGIDRSKGKAALKQMIRVSQKAASTGRHLLIFPQGTRLAPDAYQPYHSGLYALYSATGLPVVPVALNSGYFWSRDSISKTPGQITVRLLPPIPPGLTRQELMAKVEEAIETESRQLAPKI
ncbi:MAG: 1-acyl-sn-glycerol-3-phosphate acyltransferase [Alphaproteobacteria bacterium]|nr:1-acyl-sn-glycerol-3-phosphate acyltransferase [Alphaproteobacteria bacterium]